MFIPVEQKSTWDTEKLIRMPSFSSHQRKRFSSSGCSKMLPLVSTVLFDQRALRN
ncbi:hypothetical protein BYT27DRAFT_7179858 [Phlegmacium glaucopus]|nr:hypothetical protein BYT27DRAFT_7204638 [Phlegmacium glaucopus]KAF8814144.1 hypothetical protein BYT27DRAFT_7179858 [Phlegmacium glaucopus]